MHNYSNQRGSAIIVALFVMAIAVAASVAMLSHTSINIRRTQLVLNSNQANLYAQGSIAWAISELTNDYLQQKPNKLVDPTPINSKTEEINGYKIQTTIEDMQGLFNLNNLANVEYQKNYLRLLHATDPHLNLGQLSRLIAATKEWITLAKTDETDAYYAKQKPPYRAPHRLMTSVSELRLVKGFTPELYNKLLPYITTLPESTPININNASAPVYASLSQTLTPEAAASIELKRKQTPFTTTQEFLSQDTIKNNPIPAEQITVLSSYFLVKTSVKVDQQETTLYTLLLRTVKDSKPNVTALWQTKGTL